MRLCDSQLPHFSTDSCRRLSREMGTSRFGMNVDTDGVTRGWGLSRFAVPDITVDQCFYPCPTVGRIGFAPYDVDPRIRGSGVMHESSN